MDSLCITSPVSGSVPGYCQCKILSKSERGLNNFERYYVSDKYINDLEPKGVHENRTKEVENKVDDTLKLVVFLECAQC